MHTYIVYRPTQYKSKEFNHYFYFLNACLLLSSNDFHIKMLKPHDKKLSHMLSRCNVIFDSYVLLVTIYD